MRLKTRLRADDGFARRLLQHAAAGRGKRLRARLALLSARVCGLTGPKIEQLAAALELLHQATLVHDDVIDESHLRRHRLTLNARFGNQAAVLAGDYIFMQAVSLLSDGQYPDAVDRIVIRAATDVCLGEIRELEMEKNPEITPAQYLNVVSKKTASLLSAACESGAVLAQASPPVAGRLKRYGFEFGVAFQIRDDLLDFTGREIQLGKPVGADIREGRITLPVIYGLRRCRGRERRALLAAVRRGGVRTRPILRLLESSGALAQAGETARIHARRAQAALRGLPAGPALTALRELAEFSVERNY